MRVRKTDTSEPVVAQPQRPAEFKSVEVVVKSPLISRTQAFERTIAKYDDMLKELAK